MFDDLPKIKRALDGDFAARSVLVVGDLMLDRYLWGAVERISPEAPVPVVKITRRSETLGGAANVVHNLVKLGLKAGIAGRVGDDEAGRRVCALLRALGCDTGAVLSAPAFPTITKTRIIGGHQQMLRLDEEEPARLTDVEVQLLLDAVEQQLAHGVAAIVLSDYGKGLLNAPLCRAVISACQKKGIPILVDPKGTDYRKYAGATLLSPNRLELQHALGLRTAELPVLYEQGQSLRQELGVKMFVLTLSEHGLALLDDSGVRHFPAAAREVFDVSGAGDTVIATLAAALAADLTPPDALRLANLAGGIVVGKVGTAPVSAQELNRELCQETADSENKIRGLETLRQSVADWRARGETIVFTNGCFDLLHVGHMDLLARAKREGQRLVVAVNTDDSVRLVKGPGRPVIPQNERARQLAWLAAVDAVILFDEPTPLNLIITLRPDVLVKGNQYDVATIPGAKEVQGWGGRVALLPVVEGWSTTRIVSGIAGQT